MLKHVNFKYTKGKTKRQFDDDGVARYVVSDDPDEQYTVEQPPVFAGSVKDSFYAVFDSCDVSSQKLFALIATMANDSLFGEFVYEVVREKMIIGSNELADSDIRIFFKNKQDQDEKVAGWTDPTIKRLGASYKSFLFEAGIIDRGKTTRAIFKPILDPLMERWLLDQRMDYYLKALTGVR